MISFGKTDKKLIILSFFLIFLFMWNFNFIFLEHQNEGADSNFGISKLNMAVKTVFLVNTRIEPKSFSSSQLGVNRKRSQSEIIHDILQAIQKEKKTMKPTRILYKSNLSPIMLKSYLETLILNNFIKEHIDRYGKKTYGLTELGSRYIRDYSAVNSFMKEYKLK